MKQIPKNVAAFDFDGTLFPGDSIVQYLRFCIHGRVCPWTQFLRAGTAYVAGLGRTDGAVSAKEKTLSFLKGKTESEMALHGRQFIEQYILPSVFPQGLNEMNTLKRNGVTVILLSASPNVYMQYLREYLPVDDIICTVCQVDRTSRYTGRIGSNCRGEEKVRRLSEYLNLPVQNLRIRYAYGDSVHDVPLLRCADSPVLINPDRVLKTAFPGARVESWRET